MSGQTADARTYGTSDDARQRQGGGLSAGGRALVWHVSRRRIATGRWLLGGGEAAFLFIPSPAALNVMFTCNPHTPSRRLCHQLQDNPFAVCCRRCPVYACHIGPLAVEDRIDCNLPWALTVRTR